MCKITASLTAVFACSIRRLGMLQQGSATAVGVRSAIECRRSEKFNLARNAILFFF